MFTTTARYHNNRLSSIATVLLGLASLFGLQSCDDLDLDTSSSSVTVTGGSVTEGDSGTRSIAFTVSLSEPSDEHIFVDYATSDGTAVAGADYTATSGTLAVLAGATSTIVTVDVAGDTEFEFDETLTLTLSNPVSAVLSAVASATGTITDDDDADPEGYFTGVANVNNTDYNDMAGIAYNNRLIMFSPSANVLYDIAITSISDMDYTGTVEVYLNGNALKGSITVSGTTNEAQIKGTFAGGTGFAIGSFDILFDTQNNRGATLARIETSGQQWNGDVYGYVTDTGGFTSDLTGFYTGYDDAVPSCIYTGNFVIPDSNLNVYMMDHDVLDNVLENVLDEVTCGYIAEGHTGFASVIDNIGTDDKLVYAFTNGMLSLFAIMHR
jgi:hypothetical protein